MLPFSKDSNSDKYPENTPFISVIPSGPFAYRTCMVYAFKSIKYVVLPQRKNRKEIAGYYLFELNLCHRKRIYGIYNLTKTSGYLDT